MIKYVLLNKHSAIYRQEENLKIDWEDTEEQKVKEKKRRERYRLCICYESIV